MNNKRSQDINNYISQQPIKISIIIMKGITDKKQNIIEITNSIFIAFLHKIVRMINILNGLKLKKMMIIPFYNLIRFKIS